MPRPKHQATGKHLIPSTRTPNAKNIDRSRFAEDVELNLPRKRQSSQAAADRWKEQLDDSKIIQNSDSESSSAADSLSEGEKKDLEYNGGSVIQKESSAKRYTKYYKYIFKYFAGVIFSLVANLSFRPKQSSGNGVAAKKPQVNFI